MKAAVGAFSGIASDSRIGSDAERSTFESQLNNANLALLQTLHNFTTGVSGADRPSRDYRRYAGAYEQAREAEDRHRQEHGLTSRSLVDLIRDSNRLHTRLENEQRQQRPRRRPSEDSQTRDVDPSLPQRRSDSPQRPASRPVVSSPRRNR